MSERVRAWVLAAGLAAALTGCGQKGPLYLPERSGEVVTRPAAPPPDSQAPSTPQTVDSPQGPDNPAPEVAKPDEEKKPAEPSRP